MSDSTLRTPTASAIRAELEQLVLADLLGPAGGEEEEVDEARVTERYVVGMLAPRQTTIRPERIDALAIEGDMPTEEGEAEPDAPPNATLFPSSFGLTFTVAAAATHLDVAASWGRYERASSELHGDDGDSKRVWERIPCGGQLNLPLTEGEVGSIAPDAAQPEVVVEGRVRRHQSAEGGEWLVSLFLVNRQTEPAQRKDEAWLFQVELSVTAPDGRPIFRRRPLRARPLTTPDAAEARALEMAHRRHIEFAVGHGVAVHADVAADDPRAAVRLTTAVVPAYELPPTVAPSSSEVRALAQATFDMAELAEATSDQLPGMLTPLVDAYETWIDEQQARIGDPQARLEGYEDVAELTLERCRKAAQRIRAGIELLTADETAAEGFRFANRAMALQRIRTLAGQERRRDRALSLEQAIAAVDQSENRSWRPFQLAFVLLNLPSLTDPSHPERGAPGLVDLLWFPTGGGKTEAYLGLTAYTIGLRRLHGQVAGYDGTEGVAVIMRYTLRLLTVQQFQRATALICACEAIRRKAADQGDLRWGTTPIRIGLWVGMRATPNTTEDADQWVKQARGAAGWLAGRSGSPAQLTVCPWCGSDINPKSNITVDKDLRRTFLYCGDPTGQCLFTPRRSPREGLPALVVDEEIYRLLPALLIGTVDKFAQLPWRGPVQTLFGQVKGRCERHGFRTPDDDDANSHPKRGSLPPAKTVPAGPLRPPDLIIQDELHLISGPLGSMVGLYETAVDQLATWQVAGRPVRPKVVASTATVRRAGYQAHQLFWRHLEVFPPPGLDAADSFFARQREPSEETAGRRYRGICAHGRRFKAVLIRIYVAHLAAAQYLYEKYGTAVDPYMTVVGYFNSLRELGGMRRLVEDDVASRLRRTDRHGLARRLLGPTQELTSRIGSGDIPVVLERLSVPFNPGGAADQSPRPIDVLLATNMVSVGVDVPRLGAMVVAGQPKTTAEYIQATSRIGRVSPGLVWTVYNWARPRDLSHYETFEHYHATFYQHVEALSVTPFAPRALDRGLTALLVALARHHDLAWNPESAAQQVDTTSARANAIVEAIHRRAVGVTSRGEVGEEVAHKLRQRLDEWQAEQAITNRRLAYRPSRDGTTAGLLKSPGMEGWDEWTCLTSLRDVEPGIRLLLAAGDLGEAHAPAFEPAESSTGDAGVPPAQPEVAL